MTTAARTELAISDLRKHFGGALETTDDALRYATRDFGGIVRRRPVAVLRPTSASDVVIALRIASEHSVAIVARGSGHSQAGQCLGEGIVLDMRSLSGVVRVSPEEDSIEVDGGTAWRAVVDATFQNGLLPVGLTHVLDTTVAGTLSVAGFGAEAFRVGAQVDNVQFLEVATIDEGIVRCSRSERRDLFDAVRSGLGQCGVITRVGYRVRRCAARLRSRYFKFTDVDRFMQAADTVCASEWASFVSGALARDHDGKTWVLLLIVGVEHDGSIKPVNVQDLAFDEELPEQDAPIWSANGIPGHMFFRLHAPAPGTPDADPETLHPWVEHVFERVGARVVLESLLNGRSPVTSLGTNALGFLRRAEEPAPLFAVPPTTGMLWGIGVFAAAPPMMADVVALLMNAYSEWGRMTGGKRYLSGFVEFASESAWAEHYGGAWAQFTAAKARFDQKRILNPDFIRWPGS